MRRTRSHLTALLLLCTLIARADGIPTAEPLAFTGLIELSSGLPVADGQHAVRVDLFDAELSGTLACTTSATVSTARGVARVPLSASCRTAVHDTPDLWAELSYEGQLLSPRLKLGAAPYAVEAARAKELSPSAIVPGAQLKVGSITADKLSTDGGVVTTSTLRRARVVTNSVTASMTYAAVTASCDPFTELALNGGCQVANGNRIIQSSPSAIITDGGSTSNGGFFPTSWVCGAEGSAAGFALYAFVTCQPLE